MQNIPLLARALGLQANPLGQARATIGYLVYKYTRYKLYAFYRISKIFTVCKFCFVLRKIKILKSASTYHKCSPPVPMGICKHLFEFLNFKCEYQILHLSNCYMLLLIITYEHKLVLQSSIPVTC